MKVVLIRHNDDPEDDRVAQFFRLHGITPEVKRPFKGEALGDAGDDVLASVVFGGPFSVYDEDRQPFLNSENRWIEHCLKNKVPLLGICQGAQSIARVLGAKVGPKDDGTHEFGYYRVTPTEDGKSIFPGPMIMAQSHFHGFDVPSGASLLAASDLFPHQAFAYEKAIGFQFHAEVTPSGFRRWQNKPWAYFGKPGAQNRSEQDILMSQHDDEQHRWFMGFLGNFFRDAVERLGSTTLDAVD
jgi:GMP synthase (glutamine-hydrolysing)